MLLREIRKVRSDNYGAALELLFEGKTGIRPDRSIGNLVPYLRTWLDNHPNRNDGNTSLFYSNISEGIRGRAMT